MPDRRYSIEMKKLVKRGNCMKKWGWILCIAFNLLLFVGIEDVEAANENVKRYIGLHDRVLPITDVRVIEGDTKVPFKEIAAHLYLLVEERDGKTIIKKRDKEMIIDSTLGVTITNGIVQKGTPFMEVDGQMYISVKYIAREMGFKIEYFRNLQTIRIYRDNYPHMSHKAYEEMLFKFIRKQKTTRTSNKATIYLTFDDGPNTFTMINNATLEKYKVPATFFFLGNQMKNNTSIVKAVHHNGHYIGSHSMTHDKLLVYGSTESFIAEMVGGADLIKQITGETANLVRVPYGSMPHVTTDMRNSLVKHGYKMWDWNVDSNDWRYGDKQADQIVKNVQEGVTKAAKSGDKNIIILLHDRSQTTIALPKIIEWLQKEGYSFKTYEPSQHITQNFHHEPLL